MPPKRMRKDVEEAVHLRNQQLMNAALRGDVEEVISLIERGADVAGARDVAPFSKGDKLFVLAALLLQGTFSKETLAVAQVLLQHGASLDDVMPLPSEAHFAHHLNPLAAAVEAEVAVAVPVSPRQRPASSQRTRAASPTGNAEARSAVPDVATNTAAATTTTMVHKKANARGAADKAGEGEDDQVDQGTVLHYLVALGDHTHLMQLLTMAGQPVQPAGTLPQSLLRHVELFLTALTNHAATGSMTNMDGTANNNSGSNAAAGEGKAIAGGNATSARGNAAAGGGGQTYGARRSSRMLSPRGSSSRGGPRGGNNTNNNNNPLGAYGNAANSVSEAYALAAVAATIRSTSLPVLPSMTAVTAVPCLEQTTITTTEKKKGTGQVASEETMNTNNNNKYSSSNNAAAVVRFDLEARTTHTALTPLELALRCGDVIAARLLLFYGAMPPFLHNVNGLQTRLARACSLGDVAAVERLLDMGDSVTQISRDGRYTLVHYAVGQPAVLRYLAQRGLSLEAENAFGETALASLIRHGTGRNAEYAIRETPQLADAAKLATLPACAVRNYILTPLPPLVGGGSAGTTSMSGGGGGAMGNAGGGAGKGKGGGAASGGGGGGGGSGRGGGGTSGGNSAGHHHNSSNNSNAIGDGKSGDAVPHRIGGPETWPWWSFTSLPTIDLIHHLVEAGADVNGLSHESGLPYYGENSTATSASYNHRGSPAFAPQEAAGAMAAQMNHIAEDGLSDDEERFFYGQVRRSIVASEAEKERLVASPADRDSAALEVVRVRDIQPQQPQEMQHPGNTGQAAALSARLVVRPPLSMTPLMHAIAGYHPELIRKLVLEYRAAVMARDSQGACALHYAALCRHASVMSFLLSAPVIALTSGTNAAAAAASLNSNTLPAEMEIDINATDAAGRTPLHYAAAKANVAVVALLLAQGTALQANRPDQHGLTPLHVAVQANHISVVELLVRHCDALFGAWPGSTGNALSNPMGFAAGSNYTTNTNNGNNFAALTTTASSGSVNSGNAMMNGSPNAQASSLRRPNRTTGRAGNTSPGMSALSSMTSPGQGRTTRSMSASSRSLSPGGAGLMMAMMSGGGSNNTNSSAAAAAALAMASTEYTLVDPETRDTEEQATALEMAIKWRRHAEIVRLLLCEAHASHQIDSGLSNGGSLLHRAVWDGELAYVRLLLDHFANPNEVDNADCTPLLLAIRQTSFVRVNAETNEAYTVAGSAATELAVQMIEALLQAGAVPQLQSAVSLDTALHAAARRGEREILYRVFHDPSAFARRLTNMSEHIFFARAGARKSSEQNNSNHQQQNMVGGNGGGGGSNEGGASPTTMEGPLGSRQGSLSQSDMAAPAQAAHRHGHTTHATNEGTATISSNTSGSLVGRKARERLEQRRRLAAEAEGRNDTAGGYASASESEPSKASLAPHHHHTSTEGGRNEDMNLTQPYRDDTGAHGLARRSFAQRHGSLGSPCEGNGPAHGAMTLLLLRPRSVFGVSDADARTPLHLLCAHSDATRQAHVLPFIKELVLCPTHDAHAIGDDEYSEKDNNNNNNSNETSREREKCVALCERMDATGRTALHEACLALFVDAMEVLLTAAPQLVGFVDAAGNTPLHDCVRGASDVTQCTFLQHSNNNDGNSSGSGNSKTAPETNSQESDTNTTTTSARVTRAIALLHDAVQRCSPLTLRGFPAPYTAFATSAACGLPSTRYGAGRSAANGPGKGVGRTPYSEVCKAAQHVSITSLLRAGELRGVAQRPPCHVCTTAATTSAPHATIHTKGGANVVRGWSEYASLTDSHGRTALLLAGEVGHVSAARQLLRLAQQHEAEEA